MTDIREGFIHKNRIIIKIGSSTLTHASGKLNYHRIEKLVMEIADLQNQGKQQRSDHHADGGRQADKTVIHIRQQRRQADKRSNKLKHPGSCGGGSK